MLTDTHCHIYNEYYNNIDDLIKYINDNNINRIMNNGCDLRTSKEVIELSKKYDCMYSLIGLHPEENLEEINDVIALIKENLDNPKMIGIGEIGLDYYYSKDNKLSQIKIFRKQLELAEKYSLPVIVHSREATGDTINILKEYKVKGIIHCFNGSVETAKEYIKLGYKLGINGVVTFKNCKLIETLKVVGVDNIVFETDSPYLTPVPDRGKTNNPSYINTIVDFLVDNLEIKKYKLVEISNRNINEIFDI